MDKCKIFLTVLYVLFLCLSIAETACLPVFTRKTTNTLHTRDNVVFLCEILSCKTLTRVQYEKTDTISPSMWTPIYEALNSSHHSAQASGSDYNLNSRVEHDTVDSHFILRLLDVTVKDNGWWRCVVEDTNNVRHESIAVPLTVDPEKDVTIKPLKPEFVAGQSENFTCEINGIYPKPNIAWILNGTKYPGNTTLNELRDYGLWYAANTAVQLEFDKPGRAVLVCSLTTDNGDPLVETNITIDVKEPAKIAYPNMELLIKTNLSSQVVMTCSGSGYRPRITWQRNGFEIVSDNQRYISSDCDTSTCTGTLTITQIDPPLTCEQVLDLAGEYSCIITLEPPYTSAQTSKLIDVQIMHKPLPKEQPKPVVIGESGTVTLRCEVCNTTIITSVWTFNGEILHGNNVQQPKDGSLILTGDHPSGAYNRTVRNSFGSFSCIVQLVDSDSPQYLTIMYSVLSALGFLLVIIALWLVGKRLKCIPKLLCWRGRPPGKEEENAMTPIGRQPGKEEENAMIPIVLDTQLPDSPKSASFAKTVQLTEETWSIWRSTHPDCVFVGGHQIPSITMINNGSISSRYLLPTGTSIVNGLSINTEIQVINVYDKTSKSHSIYSVDIEPISTDGQQPINTPLKLSAKIKQPRCIFAIDPSSIGIYCARKRMIEVFNIMYIPKQSSVGIIKLTKYDANVNDSLCVNTHGHICVLSYNLCSVYIHNRRGDFIYTFNTGMLYDPLHIQCFSDNSLAVVNLHGEIRRFHENSESKIIKLDANVHLLQAGVFTKSSLWVIDAFDSTKMHVFKTNAIQEHD